MFLHWGTYSTEFSTGEYFHLKLYWENHWNKVTMIIQRNSGINNSTHQGHGDKY